MAENEDDLVDYDEEEVSQLAMNFPGSSSSSSAPFLERRCAGWNLCRGTPRTNNHNTAVRFFRPDCKPRRLTHERYCTPPIGSSLPTTTVLYFLF